MLDIKVKRARLTAQLPPTPCTPEMEKEMRDVARELEISVAEAQRAAFSLFLSTLYSKPIVIASNAMNSEKESEAKKNGEVGLSEIAGF